MAETWDPDKFIADHTDSSFDPDAFINKHSTGGGAQGGFDIDKLIQRTKRKKLPKTTQEMHPDLDFLDRAKVKNLATDPVQGAAYLQQQYPDHDFDISREGQIRMKKKSEKSFKVVDPDTGFFSGPREMLRDASDIGYDAVAAVGEAAATAAGGLTGAALTGGWGALPMASVAGGASGAALEAGRQELGSYLDIPDNYDPDQIKMAGAFGAVSPLLFGSGATGAQALRAAGPAAEALAKKAGVELSSPAGKEILEKAAAKAAKSQSGLLVRGAASAVPFAGEWASGVDSGTLKSYTKNYDAIKAMEKDPNAVTNLVTNLAKETGAILRSHKKEVGDPYYKALADDGVMVPLEEVHKPFQKAMERLDGTANRMGTPEAEETALAFREAYEGMLTRQKAPLSAQTGVDADTLGKKLNKMANFDKRKAGDTAVAQGWRKGADDAVDELIKASGKAKGKLNESFEEVLGQDTLKAKRAYGKVLDDEAQVGRLLKSVHKSDATLRNLGSSANETGLELFGRLDSTYGTNLIAEAEKLDAYKLLGKKASPWAVSSKGTVSTMKSALTAGGLGLTGGYAGYYVGSQLGGSGYGSGTAGFLAGAALGTFVGGPKAMRNFYIPATHFGKKFLKAADNSIPISRIPQTVPLTAFGAQRPEGDDR